MKGQRLGLTFPQRIDSAQTVSQGTPGGGVVVPAAIHFWPMNEGSGATFVDNIGTTNLTASNVTWAVTTGLGAAAVAQFNGTNASAVAASVDASLNFNGTQPMTVAFWARYAATSTSTAIVGTLMAPTTFAGWEVGNSTGTPVQDFLVVGNVGSNQMTAQSTTQNITVGTSALFVVTYSGSLNVAGVRMYVNATPQTITDSTGTLTSGATSTQPLIVGSRGDGSSRFQGALAYMRVWNQVLTPAQITKLASLGPQ